MGKFSNALLFLLISLVFFVRGKIFEDFMPVSASYFIPIIAVLLILGCFLRIRFRLVRIPLYIAITFLFIIINALLSSYLTNKPGLSLVFLIEYSISFIVYYAIYIYLISNGNDKGLFDSLIWGSLFGSIPILLLSTYQDTIRRIGTGETNLPVSVGHIGPSLAVATIVSLFFLLRLYKNKDRSKLTKYLLLFAFLLSFSGMVLTGSKTALGGFVLSILIITFLDYRYRKYILATSIILILSLFYYINNNYERYSDLLTRFTVERVQLGFEQRFNSFDLATKDIEAKDLVIGQSWRYQPLNNSKPIHYPHNFLLSNILHVGLIPAFLILYAFLRHFWYFTKKMFFKKHDKLKVYMIFSCYNITFINIMFSGRITRVITVFVFFAIVDLMIRSEKESILNTNTQVGTSIE